MTQTSYWVSPFPPTSNPTVASGLWTSALDWTKFLYMILNGGTHNGNVIIDENLVDMIYQNQANGATESSGVPSSYGFGMLIDGDQIWHPSATGCIHFINRAKRYIGFVFTNVYDGKSSDYNNQIRSVSSQIVYSSSCTPIAPTPVAPTPSPSSGSQFNDLHVFIVNGTGNSVDFGQVNGIAPNKVALFTGMINEGVDGIRHAMKIGGYNPSEGVYHSDKLSAFINWTKGLRSGRVLQEIMVVPLLSLGDSRLEDKDYHCDADGHRADCTLNLDAVPSYFSENAISILDEAYHRFFSHIQQNHANDVYLFSFAGGNSEEHYMPYASNYPGGPGCGDNGYGGIGDYSESAQNAWVQYQLSKWSGLLPFLVDGQQYVSGQAPMPRIAHDNQNNRFVNFSRRDHREVYRFWNTGTYKAWERFVDIGRQYLPNALYESFVADMYNQQGIQWTMNAGAMHKLMQKANVWYHTEHHSPGDWAKCLVAIDIFEGGTYGPGKISATEFDSTDAGNSGGGPFDEDLMVRKVEKMIDHGLRITHFALDWTPLQISALGRVMARVRSSRNNNSGYVRPALLQRPVAQVFNVNTANMFNDSDYLYRPWEQAGNKRSNPFDARIINIRVDDGFSNNE